MGQRLAQALVAAALGGILAAPAALAAEASGGGTGSYVTTREESLTLPGGERVRRFRSAGLLTAEAGSPFDRTEQDCSGTEVVEPDGERVTSAGYCDGTDRDGDVWWVWWRGDAKGAVWGLLGGTGKFAGLKGGGSLRYVDRWPSGKYTIKWEGTWTSE